MVFPQALGDRSLGLPAKLLSLTPPHFSPPHPASHARTCSHAFSFTALCIGTTVRMSAACGSWFFRFIASKNWRSEGYTQCGSDEEGIRGMEEITRSSERRVGREEGRGDVEEE